MLNFNPYFSYSIFQLKYSLPLFFSIEFSTFFTLKPFTNTVPSASNFFTIVLVGYLFIVAFDHAMTTSWAFPHYLKFLLRSCYFAECHIFTIFYRLNGTLTVKKSLPLLLFIKLKFDFSFYQTE